ncbi:MAG: hypothetical protein A3E84_02395 [Gammaproteobacteria bacterium RIFCSPHIGHO2_12_FULL_42_13]|nr:MAG: hypothetical protein A3E84_02395 [Gammaproteobacteria bacterium RIFCSPHIGHO2_12_FULL_42_13]
MRLGKGVWHYLGKSLKLLLLVILLFGGIFFFNQNSISDYFPIAVVRIYGIEHLQSQELQQVLTPLVQRGFFTVDVDLIRERLLQEPWVSDVFVRRVWPARVDITLIERRPAAKWNNVRLLSTTGDLFQATANTFPDLPRFVGPDGMHNEMLQYYDEMNRILLSLHVKIAYLELTPYSSWKIILDNGIAVKINHKDLLTRLTQFVRVYPRIIGDRTGDVEFVDLRYPYGVAVHWKTAVKT